ncbi:unnamed protein product [Closterium sp. NIES-53]
MKELGTRRHRPVHWTAAVRVAKYLATTSGVGLVLGGRRDVVLIGHCDSSYADDAETHRSTQGYCFSLGSRAVLWRSTRSSSVLTSTAEAEIYAGAMAAQELRWLMFLLTDLSERPSSAPTLFSDNKAKILLCQEPRLESRVKHINIRYFLLRELQRRGHARFDFVESEANTADIFTKALPPCDHERCCVQLGLLCFFVTGLVTVHFWSLQASNYILCNYVWLSTIQRRLFCYESITPNSVSTADNSHMQQQYQQQPMYGMPLSNQSVHTTAAAASSAVAAATPASAATTAAAVVTGSTNQVGQQSSFRRPRESLTPQQLCEWHARWGCRGGRAAPTATATTAATPATATTAATTATAARGGGQMQLQCRPRESLTPHSGASGSGQVQLQRRPREALSPQQLQFGDTAELPSWLELLQQRVDIFALDYNAILTAMYALSTSVEGACHLCLPPDPGIHSAALGARTSPAPGVGEAAAIGTGESTAPGSGESALSGAAPAAVLHTFTLDSGASRSFFRDSTTLTPLTQPVAVSLADPSGGPVLAHSSTALPCPAASSGLLSRLHLPSFSTNLASGADLQDAWVDQFTPGGQRVTHCTCSRTGRYLATFTHRPGSSLYTLTTAPPPVSASGQIAASSQVFAAASRSSPASAPCSCHPLSHETLLWHHRLGHPSLPRLRGMAARALVSGLPRSLHPLPPGPAPTCVPCVEGRQHAAPHSSTFPPTEAPLQTLHMDVWGPARVRGEGHERYFLLVVDDYSRYTSVFPLRSKDRGGEFSSDLLRAFCCSEGIRQTFTLPASPQQNGIAERRIGMYAAHQINLQPRVSLPETTPTLRWTGKVGDASAFRVWGSRAFVRDTTADKLSSRAVPYVFLGFPRDAPGWQFYHPTSRRVLSSQDVTFDESVTYYGVFPYRTASLPPPPLFLAPDPAEPVEVAVDSGATRSAEPADAGTGGAEPGVSVSDGAELGGAASGGAEPGRVEPEGTAS